MDYNHNNDCFKECNALNIKQKTKLELKAMKKLWIKTTTF